MFGVILFGKMEPICIIVVPDSKSGTKKNRCNKSVMKSYASFCGERGIRTPGTVTRTTV